MTSDPIPDAPEATLSSATAGPGRVIRQARERAKLAIEELATVTRLTRATLEALERDDFSNLTEAVYVRGYYRKCAKVLNLPEAELIAAYDKLYAPKNAPMPTKLLLGNSGSTMGSIRVSDAGGGSGWVIVVLIAALIGAGVWFVTQDAPDALPAPAAAVDPGTVTTPIPAAALVTPPSSEAAATIPAAASAAPAVPPVAAADGSTPPAPPVASPGLALTPATSLSSLSAAEAAAAAPVPAPAPAATSSGSALQLSFKSSSWVRIEDADGRTLLSGTMPSGDRQVVRGRAPYSLFIGYAPGVTVEFDGKPFDLTPHIRENSTARVNLP